MKLWLQFILSLLLLAQSNSRAEVTRYIDTSQNWNPSSPSPPSPAPHYTLWLLGASGKFSASSGSPDCLTVSIKENYLVFKG